MLEKTASFTPPHMGRNAIKHFGKPLGAISAGIATAYGLVFALGGETFRAAWWAWGAVLYPHWVAIAFLVWLASDYRDGSLSSPTVKVFRKAERLILAGTKDWLGINVAVLIYKREGDFERLLCEGVVVNIQGNGLIQIRLLTDELPADHVSDIEDRITEGDLNTLIIKPGQSVVSI